jgi:hypothetical protein
MESSCKYIEQQLQTAENGAIARQWVFGGIWQLLSAKDSRAYKAHGV